MTSYEKIIRNKLEKYLGESSTDNSYERQLKIKIYNTVLQSAINLTPEVFKNNLEKELDYIGKRIIKLSNKKLNDNKEELEKLITYSKIYEELI